MSLQVANKKSSSHNPELVVHVVVALLVDDHTNEHEATPMPGGPILTLK